MPMNDPRDQLSPDGLQTTFGMAPQPGPPDLSWGFAPINQPPLGMWNRTRISMADWPAVPVPSTGGILGDLSQSLFPNTTAETTGPTGVLGNLGQQIQGLGSLWADKSPFEGLDPDWLKFRTAWPQIYPALLSAGVRHRIDANGSSSDPLVPHPGSAKYWPATPASSSDEQSAAGATTARSPRAGESIGPLGMTYLPADEAALAQDAYAAAARRLVRGVRGRESAPDESPTLDPETDNIQPGLIERIRLNGVDSFYRGSLAGAGRLALMHYYATTSDEPGINPRTKRWRDQLRKEYPRVVADLAHYDRMERFSNPFEFGAAAIGQLGGGLPSPETLIGGSAKGAHLLWRLGKAGLQQGATSAAIDPIVQGLNIQAGVQDEFDPWRSVIAGAIGTGTGAGTGKIHLSCSSGPMSGSRGIILLHWMITSAPKSTHCASRAAKYRMIS